MVKYLGIRTKHHRVKTPRDTAMSAAMRSIRASHPGIPQTQVLSMASKSVSGHGYHITPHARHHAYGLHLAPHVPHGKGLRLY